MAWCVPPELASEWAMTSGEPAEDLHVTISFCGKDLVMDAVQVDQMRTVLARLAHASQPFQAKDSGTGLFTTDDDGYALVMLVDSPGLEQLQHRVSEELEKVGVPVAKNHGYTAHLTLRYFLDPPGGSFFERDLVGTFLIDRITLKMGEHREDFLLGK